MARARTSFSTTGSPMDTPSETGNCALTPRGSPAKVGPPNPTKGAGPRSTSWRSPRREVCPVPAGQPAPRQVLSRWRRSPHTLARGSCGTELPGGPREAPDPRRRAPGPRRDRDARRVRQPRQHDAGTFQRDLRMSPPRWDRSLESTNGHPRQLWDEPSSAPTTVRYAGKGRRHG